MSVARPLLATLLATMRLDVRLQARSRLYVIGMFVALLLGLALRALVPAAHVGRGLAAFYVLGLGGTTFMFGASMLLLERGEGTLAALRTTPLRARDYVASKVLTLTGFALAESAVVFGLAARGLPPRPALLALGALVLGAFYTLVGLGLAAPYREVTRFLLPSGALVATVLQLPALSLLEVGPAWVYYLLPTQACVLIFRGAYEPLSLGELAYAGLMSPLMLLGAALWCRRRFRTHVGLGDGGRR